MVIYLSVTYFFTCSGTLIDSHWHPVDLKSPKSITVSKLALPSVTLYSSLLRVSNAELHKTENLTLNKTLETPQNTCPC